VTGAGVVRDVRELSTLLNIGCKRREMVIIALQGKNIWHPANRRNDGP